MSSTASSASIDAAVVLLSGGLDSATTLAIARAEAKRVLAISFDYGQRHRFELEAARRVAESIGVQRHVVTPIDLRAFGGSALTSDRIDVPRHASPGESPPEESSRDERTASRRAEHIPVTYVPARNTVFLALALALAESAGAMDIYLGVNAVDYSGYPDCRPAFVEAFERLANLATRAGVEGRRFRIHAPLINMTKAEIIRRGVELGVDYAMTHSCYDPEPESGAACGACDSCILRRRGFEEAGLPDPTRYQ